MNETDARQQFLVEAPWLSDHLHDTNLLILDCRKSGEYHIGHIPGGVHMPLDYWLKEASPDGSPRGVHLLPEASLEQLMRRLGVANNRLVVVYDDNCCRASARLWWVLRYLGHVHVRVLDGGWNGWLTQGSSVERSHNLVPASRFKAQLEKRRIARFSDVLDAASSGRTQILDARSAEEWSGEDPHGNRRGGHVPGAVHLEWSQLLTKEPPFRFLSVDEIRATIRAAGVDTEKPIITYCQGGIRAAFLAFALELVGCEDVRVYDGSMREWANSEMLPLVD